MPRNSSGIYTLPNAPVVTGTTIDSADENDTRDDLASEMTNSLDRQGRGAMTAALKIVDGSASSPGIQFSSDANNGWYRNSADNWSGSAGSVEVVNFSTNGMTLFGYRLTPLSPAQITSNQNDYAPTGFSTVSMLRLDTDAARDLTGFAGGTTGRVVDIYYTGSTTLTLKNESASSSAANRFALPADLVLGPGMSVRLVYDGTSARWRMATGAVSSVMAPFTMAASVTDARTALGLGTMAVEAKTITTRGDLIRGGAGGALERLALGAAGTVLQSDGTDVVYASLSLPASSPSVRQTQRLGPVDSSGYNATLSAGSGLNFNVDASPTAVVLDFAAGSVDYTATITADASNQGSLVASNTNFIHATYVSASSVTWSNCLVPPQEGFAFDRTQNSLLHFEQNGSTPLCDFGNTYSLNGGAAINNTKPAYGSYSLDIDAGTGGGTNADCAYTTGVTSLGDGSWSITCVGWHTTGPNAGVAHVIAGAVNDSGFGAYVSWYNNAGTNRWAISMSSNGSSHNIASLSTGSSTPATGKWYRHRFEFDALAGKYCLFTSDGGSGATPSWGAEVKEVEVSSTARVCAVTRLVWGAYYNAGFTAGMVGYLDECRLLRCATNISTETPSGLPYTVADYPVHFFSIPSMTMYEVTAASASAGTNPTLTARNRVFVGEQDTNGSAVTATRNYALRGEYLSPIADVPADATTTNLSSNIGTQLVKGEVYLINKTAVQSYLPGDRVLALSYHSATGYSMQPLIARGRNNIRFVTGAQGVLAVSQTDGTAFIATSSYFRYQVSVKRSF